MTTPTIVVLTEAQHAHHAKLSPTDQATYLAKSSSDRDAEVAAALAADPIVHTTKSGLAIRKSHGDVALMLAKQGDAGAEQLATQATALAAATEANTLAALRVRAGAELSALPGTEDVKIAILRAVDTIPEALRLEALKTLAAGNVFARAAQKAPGVNPEQPTVDASLQGQFDALVTAHVAEHKCDARTARLAVVKTPAGRALYNQIALAEASRASA